MNYPWLDPREIESAAHTLLAQCFGASGACTPCVDLDAIIYDFLSEKEHLSFTDERDLGWKDGDEVLGRMLPLAGKIEITAALKRGGDLGRYRFTVAHEIGHWVLHRSLFLARAEALDLFAPDPQDAELTTLNRSVFADGARGRLTPEEWQANRFAVDLLIDADLLRLEFRQRFRAPLVARRSPGWRPRSRTLREHARHLATAEIGVHAPLCSIFGLSAEAMAIALEQRGYAVEEQPVL